MSIYEICFEVDDSTKELCCNLFVILVPFHFILYAVNFIIVWEKRKFKRFLFLMIKIVKQSPIVAGARI